MTVLQVATHIKWSHTKTNTLVIFNRIGDHKTSLIKSSAGKEAWKILTRNGFETPSTSENQLLDELHERFAGSVSFATLKHDIEQFLDSLSSEGIIRRISGN